MLKNTNLFWIFIKACGLLLWLTPLHTTVWLLCTGLFAYGAKVMADVLSLRAAVIAASNSLTSTDKHLRYS